MGDVFLSFRGRVLINTEALNMTESVGNYVKHRRVPVLVPEVYTTVFVPAISGETIAHGYQQTLAQVAKSSNIPVCNLCEKGIFLKSSNKEIFELAFNIEPPKDEFEFEKMVIEKCIVEDVGGFLYAPRAGGQVKRTSNFYTGYMIPAVETLKGAIIEPQLHTRYALGTPFVAKQEKQAGQMIYYVELASALYTFSFDIDTKYIGKITFKIDRAGESVIDEKEIVARKKTMFEAFSRFMTEMMFGAKRTRFLPVVDWESAVIAVSDDIWTVPSPTTRQYIQKSKEKLELINYNTSLFIYDSKEGGTLEKTLFEAIEEAKKRIEEQKA